MRFTEIKPLTIVQLIPEMKSGGVEQGVLDMNQAIIDRGWRSIVISNGGRMVDKIVKAGGTHIQLPLHSKNPFTILRNQRKLLQILKDNDASIVHARSRAPAWSGYCPSRKAKIPFVTTIHGAYSATHCLKKAYNRIMLKGDAVIAVSHFIASYVENTYGLSQEKITIIPRGIDASFLNRGAISKARIEHLIKTWDLPEDKRIIMLPARLTRIKGHDVLMEAIKKLNRTNLLFLCVGEGKEDYRKELLSKIKKEQLDQTIKLVGHCPDMQAAYFLSEIVLLPATKPESFGRIAVEAMAMGCMMIASNIGGTAETIIDNQTGFLVSSNDSQDLKCVIEKVLDLSADQKKLIQTQAFEHVSAFYTKEKMTEKTLALYEELFLKRKDENIQRICAPFSNL